MLNFGDKINTIWSELYISILFWKINVLFWSLKYILQIQYLVILIFDYNADDARKVEIFALWFRSWILHHILDLIALISCSGFNTFCSLKKDGNDCLLGNYIHQDIDGDVPSTEYDCYVMKGELWLVPQYERLYFSLYSTLPFINYINNHN